jgi:hypothetical protein
MNRNSTELTIPSSLHPIMQGQHEPLPIRHHPEMKGSPMALSIPRSSAGPIASEMD